MLKGNLEADYFLFINGKAVGVLEAKREEVDISSNMVSEQAITYAKSVPDCYQAWQKPLPFLYKSNGKEIDFCDYRYRDNATWDTVNRLKSATVPTDSNVVISTIQRLFSLLKGEEITDTDDDDEDTADGEVELPENPNLPHDFFDLIIIDECHRSIYGNWRKALEYFDTARLVGLTATPIPDTMAFFNNSRVVNYTLEQSIIDGVNVDNRIYRIKTRVTEEVVMFMRDVASAPLYTQMKGRGVRTIGDEQLRNVTPNALSKDCFFLVDAVGVTEHDHVIPGQYEGPETETVTLKELLERIAHGNLPDNYLKRLAATLSRLYNKADNVQREEFIRIAHDDMQEIVQRIYIALDPEQLPLLTPFTDINAPNNERKGLVAPITYPMLKDLENKLKMENNRFAPKLLWNSYAIVYGDKVRRTTKKEETEALTNIIQLVRFAYHQTEKLESAYPTARSMFNLWYGRKQMDITPKQKDLISKIVEYIAANGACNVRDIRKTDMTHAAQLIAAFGNMQKADEALDSVYNFIVLRKTA